VGFPCRPASPRPAGRLCSVAYLMQLMLWSGTGLLAMLRKPRSTSIGWLGPSTSTCACVRAAAGALATLKSTIRAFQLEPLQRWLHQAVQGAETNSSATLAEPVVLGHRAGDARGACFSSTAPRVQGMGAAEALPEGGCIFCGSAPAWNLRRLPCGHTACHLCVCQHALEVRPALVPAAGAVMHLLMHGHLQHGGTVRCSPCQGATCQWPSVQ
jgi:hypothetical protein